MALSTRCLRNELFIQILLKMETFVHFTNYINKKIWDHTQAFVFKCVLFTDSTDTKFPLESRILELEHQSIMVLGLKVLDG